MDALQMTKMGFLMIAANQTTKITGFASQQIMHPSHPNSKQPMPIIAGLCEFAV